MIENIAIPVILHGYSRIKFPTFSFTHFAKVGGEDLGIEDTFHGLCGENPIYSGKNFLYLRPSQIFSFNVDKVFPKIHRPTCFFFLISFLFCSNDCYSYKFFCLCIHSVRNAIVGGQN